jgi:hypothetical protein
MRSVHDNLDLAKLQREGIGFISNAHNDGAKLHCTGCNAVGAVVSTAFPKNYFETYAEAARWLDKKYSWCLCGICSPTND